MARTSNYDATAGATMLYGLKDAAAILGISPAALSNRIARGSALGLPPARFVLARGGLPLWTARELQAVAADRAARIATAAEGLRSHIL